MGKNDVFFVHFLNDVDFSIVERARVDVRHVRIDIDKYRAKLTNIL